MSINRNEAGSPRQPFSSSDRKQLWLQKAGRRSRVDAVICGPPGSGKSSLAAALASGAGLPSHSSLAVMPLDETAEGIEAAYRHIKGDPVSASDSQRYQVQIRSSKGDGESVVVRELSLLELKAEAPRAHDCYQAIRFAPVWVLLMDPAGKNRRWYLDRLPRWARDLAIPDRESASPPAASIGSSSSLPLQGVTRHVGRLVVVFTHMDEVARRWLPALQGLPLHGVLGNVRSLSDWEGIDRLVRRLDAAAWIDHQDSTFLRRVREYIGGPRTELFVGAVSSVGWRRPSDREPQWRPFGTGELLELILNGKVRPPFRGVDLQQQTHTFLKLETRPNSSHRVPSEE